LSLSLKRKIFTHVITTPGETACRGDYLGRKKGQCRLQIKEKKDYLLTVIIRKQALRVCKLQRGKERRHFFARSEKNRPDENRLVRKKGPSCQQNKLKKSGTNHTEKKRKKRLRPRGLNKRQGRAPSPHRKKKSLTHCKKNESSASDAGGERKGETSRPDLRPRYRRDSNPNEQGKNTLGRDD